MHREFGPGLDEADYERALHLELLAMGIEHECQVPLPLIYKGTKLDCGYRMDLVVAGWLLLKAARIEQGICLNFHAETMAAEVKRFSLPSKP